MKIKVGEQDGQISFHHEQFPARFLDGMPSPIRGSTSCRLRINEVEVAGGIAYCTVNDIFSKETGRKKALARTLQAAGLDVQIRRSVWQQYFARKANAKFDDVKAIG